MSSSMSFSEIHGQDAALSQLRQALASQSVGAAYLFVGPSGVGKQLAALALARAAICPQQPRTGCGQCETCRRVDQGVHPDVRVFGPRQEGNRNLPVELLRNEILPLTKFAPFEAASTFLIFPQADVSFPIQHPEAANALLKTLEEPRPNVHFVLLSERPDRLLPTIRSRCQRVRFAPLDGPTLARILDRRGVPEAERQGPLELAGGRADRALLLCEDGRATRMLEWALRIDAALDQVRAGELIELGEQLAGDEDRELVFDSLAAFYRDLAATTLGVAPANASSSRAAALAERAAKAPPTRAAQRVARIQLLREDLEQRNANPQLAIEGLLFELAAGGR
jgi:DNA polymerase-3 subunit delta'